MLKLISLSLLQKYNDSIDSLSLFSSFFYSRMEFPSIEMWISVDWCFILFAQRNSLTAEVHVLDKHNRELFYQDIKSNAIMVSYDCCNCYCCIPSIKLLGRSFAISSLPQSFFSRSLKLPTEKYSNIVCASFG